MERTYIMGFFVIFTASRGAHSTFHAIQHPYPHHHPHHHGHLSTPESGASQRLGYVPLGCGPGANGLFLYPYDQTKYIHCAGGRTYIEDCEPNTAFSNAFKKCIWTGEFSSPSSNWDTTSYHNENLLPNNADQNTVTRVYVQSSPTNNPNQSKFGQHSSQMIQQSTSKSTDTKFSSDNPTGSIDENSGVNVHSLGLVTGVDIKSGTDANTTEVNTTKPIVVQERPTDVSEKIPDLSLLTSRVTDEYKKYFANSSSKSPASMSVENTVDENPARRKIDTLSQRSDRPSDDSNQSRLGEESSQTNGIYMKYSKDQEPVMPIYDQPITLTVKQRLYQMPKSYNRKYYKAFIKPVDERDETDGMLISDSIKKLLLPYISTKKQNFQSAASSENDQTKTLTTNALEIPLRLDNELITPATEKKTSEQSTITANIPTIGNSQTQKSDRDETNFQPNSTLRPIQVNTNSDPDRIVFPGTHSESRKVYGYYHENQPNLGLTPQLTEMRPIHHKPN